MDIQDNWYTIKEEDKIITPALVIYPERIKRNIELMIQMAGGTEDLRPHIKTHKMAEMINFQQKFGINKFKCATIAEAELLAICNAKDILLAMPIVGIDIIRFFELIAKYPNSQFSSLVDNSVTLIQWSEMANSKNISVSLWMDINNGMNRTGIQPDEEAFSLFEKMTNDPNILVKGFHVYDGHIRDTSLEIRTAKCDKDFEKVLELKATLEAVNIPVPKIVAGGTPTFPIHCKRENVEASPGTPFLWDAGYGDSFQDLTFLPAAVLLTRAISKPSSNLICFDLGHKSVASEMPFPRVKFLSLDHCEQVKQSEEHLVVECQDTAAINISKIAYAIPMHICPTVAKYKSVLTIENHEITGSWEVIARDQKIYI